MPALFVYLFYCSPSAARSGTSVCSAGEGHLDCTGLTIGCFRDKPQVGKRRNQGISGKNNWENGRVN